MKLYQKKYQSQISKSFPIIGNLLNLSVNLLEVEWKTLSLSSTERSKLKSILKSEFVEINDIL